MWCCPVCAAKIATRRADDLATVMRAVDELGGSAFLLTLTMRHDRRGYPACFLDRERVHIS